MPIQLPDLSTEAGLLARVFIAENEINGLAFPPVESGIVIFKLGYAVDLLAGVRWLGRARDLAYWGEWAIHLSAVGSKCSASSRAYRLIWLNRRRLPH